jgi:hypothetical protein
MSTRFGQRPKGNWAESRRLGRRPAKCCGACPGLTVADERLNRPFARAADRERFLAGLRKAGLPAERASGDAVGA